mmetsp:Transcript_21833/g.54608  ORF Transcript_21833/g.54608 Transcript_21833/m.54608 type:complete len:343 (+) Transcript_21833:61-1089(+)
MPVMTHAESLRRRSSPGLVGLVVAVGSAVVLSGPLGFVPMGAVQPAASSGHSWGLRHPQASPMRTAVNAVSTLSTAGGTVETAGVRSPPETYFALADKGAANAKKSVLGILHQSFVSGCFVGFGGLLSLSIAGNLGAVASASPGLQKFVFAALFPVNLLLILNSGGQLFTGNTATVPMAVFEGKATLMELVKSWVVSILGNIIGCVGFALAAKKGGLLVGGVQNLAVAMTMMKTSIPLGQILIKAIMCNWMVCMAVFLSEAARDLGGKMVGIWFPISAFVAMSMEHSVANMFLLPAGILSGAPITIAKMVVKNWIPVAIGNAIAGTVCVAASYSYAFGALGK